MINHPDAVKKLLNQLQQVPFLASKNLYRVASHFLELDEERLAYFCQALLDSKKNAKRCETCFTWQQRDELCTFCDSPRRDNSLVCIIEGWQDLLAIERTSNFKGGYHVLGGVISPLNGVGPESLTISFLIERIKSKNIKELVLALSQTPEGEATVSYITDKLKNIDVKITGLAQGMPVGSSLEFMDRVTLSKALTNRRQLQ